MHILPSWKYWKDWQRKEDIQFYMEATSWTLCRRLSGWTYIIKRIRWEMDLCRMQMVSNLPLFGGAMHYSTASQHEIPQLPELQWNWKLVLFIRALYWNTSGFKRRVFNFVEEWCIMFLFSVPWCTGGRWLALMPLPKESIQVFFYNIWLHNQ